MPSIAAARAAFASTAQSTATPQALLVMLYDRLLLDVQRAETAHATGDWGQVNTHLTHAQDIVTELADALDPTAWEGGPGLLGLYDYLLAELVGANVAKDAARIAVARSIIEPLRDAWRSASGGAKTGTATPGAAATSAPAPAVPDRRLVAALGGTA